MTPAQEQSNRARSERLWPPDRVAELMRLVAEGLPYAEIGRRMGVTKNMVIGKAKRLGLERSADALTSARQKAQARRQEIIQARSMAQRLQAIDVFPDHGRCVFPIGHPKDAGFKFCGAVAVELKLYCGKHQQVSHDNRR